MYQYSCVYNSSFFSHLFNTFSLKQWLRQAGASELRGGEGCVRHDHHRRGVAVADDTEPAHQRMQVHR